MQIIAGYLINENVVSVNNQFTRARNTSRLSLFGELQQLFGAISNVRVESKGSLNIVFGNMGDNSRKLILRTGRPEQYHRVSRSA